MGDAMSRAERLARLDAERRERDRAAYLERVQLERLVGVYLTREEALRALRAEAMPPPVNR